MASRFWVGGTGTWDASDTTHWAASSGGAGGQSVPGSSDTVTFDGSSGGGTVTAGAAYSPNIQSITCGAFTGTLDFSANNNNVTLSTATGFSGTGSGARTINLGSGTFTLSSNAAVWDFSTVTNLTLSAASATIAFTNTAPGGLRNFIGGSGQSYGTVTVAAPSSNYSREFRFTSGSYTTLTLGAGLNVRFAASPTITTLTAEGTSAHPTVIMSSVISTARTLTVTNTTLSWLALQDITFSGGSPAATNSFDLGGNSGVTITAPSGVNRLSPGIG